MSKFMPTQPIKPLTPGPVPAPSDLDWDQLFSLHDALLTLSDVCAGLQCQPRFQCGRTGNPNDAGRYLAEIGQIIMDAAGSITERAMEAKTSDPEDMHRVLLVEELRGFESLDLFAREVARLAGSRS